MKASTKITLIFFAIIGLVLMCPHPVFADSSGGNDGGTGPSGDCKSKGNCISGATFVYYSQDDSKFPRCSGYEGVARLESTYAGTATGGKANKPTGNSRPFQDVINGTTYKGSHGYYSSWSAADNDFNSWDIDGGHLSDHPDWTYFCVRPNNPATLTYDANGGSGAPSSETCYIIGTQCKDQITISSTKPTRNGYTFAGWADSSSSSTVSWVGGNKIGPLTGDKTIYAVWLKNLTAHSKSSVSNSIGTKSATEGNTDTLISYGGSRNDSGQNTKSYDYYFVHQLKLKGDSSRAVTLTYTIERSTNGGSTWSTIASNNTVNVNGDNTYVEVRGYSASKSTFSLTQGQTSDTVCERITYTSTQYTFPVNSTTGTANNASATSTICTRIIRRSPTTISIDGNADLYVDAINDAHKNPTDIVYSTDSTRNFTYSLNITAPAGRTLGTTYTIERLTYGYGDTKDWSKGASVAGKTNISVNAPISGITDTFNVTIDEGTTKTVCERTILNPYRYEVHYRAGDTEVEDGSPDPLAGQTIVGEQCITIGRPKLEVLDDGEITVYSESSGSLDDSSQTGGYSDSQGAWLMKTDKADITFTHKLWREAEKHTGDGTNQATVTSPAEDVSVEYRLADPNTTFDATSIKTIPSGSNYTSLPKHTIATNTKNSKYSFSSNRTEPLFYTNTEASADVVGQKESKCQSIDYLSDKYTLRGQYWTVNGAIYDGNPYLQGVEAPVSKGTVGKSAQGCVNVIRPWNFRASSLTSVGDYSKPIVSGSTNNSVSFNLHVNKDKSDYLITDIPNATVRFISFVVSGEAAKNTNYQGNISSASDPCSFYQAQTGAACSALEERSNQNLGPAGATGKKKYGDAAYGNSGYDVSLNKNDIVAPKLETDQKYCIAVGVQPADSGDGFTMGTNWAISDATCFNIGKYPNFQAWGGSIFTNGGTKTSITKTTALANTQKIFGSWSDFAIIANKTISKTASGATLISGYNFSNYSNCTASPLSIANANCSGSNVSIPDLGGASITVDTENFKQKFQERYLTDPANYNVVTTIDADSLRSGRSPLILYNPNGDIYITTDIRFGNSSRSYGNANVPQVIVYAKNGNIFVDQNVDYLDAWLIADKVLNTCVDGSRTTPPLSATVCDKTLVINGPVVASQVLFNRTANADAFHDTLPDYAELVNLNSAVYLFSANEASGSQPVTTYIQKLPPRY